MNRNKERKAELVTSIQEKLLASNFIILLHYRGLSDNQLYDFRVALKEKNIGLKIAKNTLVKIAIKDTKLDALNSYLSGPVAIAYGEDAASLAKITVDTAKKHEALTIQTGFLNESILEKEAINSLSKLGSLEEVRASFISKLVGIQSNFIRTLRAPSSNVVALCNNYASSNK